MVTNRRWPGVRMRASALLLALLLGGCLVPRKHSGLAKSSQPTAPVALLPVAAPNASADSHPSREKLLRLGNEVLDTLAKRKDGRLIGPSKVLSLLGSNGVPAGLGWGVETNDAAAKVKTSDEARELARRLGVRQVVRCSLNASRNPEFGMDGSGIGLDTTLAVVAKMELVDLDPLTLRRTSTASSEGEQMKGLFMFMLPIYYGTTWGRAVDHAERAALTRLFAIENP